MTLTDSTERVLIMDLPEKRRYAIPFDVIKQHKWLTLKAQGLAWNELPDDAFTEANLIIWLQTEVSIHTFNEWVDVDQMVMDLGIQADTYLNEHIEIERKDMRDVVFP